MVEYEACDVLGRRREGIGEDLLSLRAIIELRVLIACCDGGYVVMVGTGRDSFLWDVSVEVKKSAVENSSTGSEITGIRSEW